MNPNPSSTKYPPYFLTALLLVAALFLLIGYDDRLPVLDTDEGILLAQTFRDRGLGEIPVMSVRGYPPVILGLFAATQRVTEAITGTSAVTHAELIVRVVRLLSAAANLVTVYLLYRIGDKLHSPLVGAVAALVWAVLPVVQAQMRLALTEPWQTVFVTASVWAMLQTLDTRRWSWAVAATVFGLGAVAAKYSIFTVLGLGVGATLWLAWSHHRRWLWVTLAQVGLIALAAYLLLAVYGASTLVDRGNAEPSQFMNSGLQNLVNPARVLYLYNVAAAQVGLYGLGLLALVLLIGTALFLRQASADRRAAWLLLLAFSLVHVWLVSSFLVWDPLKDRYISPASSVLALLIAVSLLSAGCALSRRLTVRAAVPLALLLGAWALPPLVTRSQQIVALTYPYTEREMVQWSVASLEPGTLAITGLEGQKWYWRLFNPIWGGYTGPHRPLVETIRYLDQPPDDWRGNGIAYVHLAGNYPGDDPPLPIRDEMLLLKAFPPPDSAQPWRGDPFYIYRVERMQHEIEAAFSGGIILVGYDLDRTRAKPGESLTVRLYWQAEQRPAADYHLYLHLSSPDNHDALAQADGTPALPGRPTFTWDDPHETLVSPAYTITIPPDIPSGEYRLLAGLYDFSTGQRLTTNEGDYVTLSRITVGS
ncbi:MAG: glycosyltransferase family 39 protein [Chloroflexi bacterium]|nr:glycosyltransferase family 39 protein [Chloroflexota bacterium]